MSNKTITQARANEEINDQELNQVVGGATYVATATASRVPPTTTTTYSTSLSLSSPLSASLSSPLAVRTASLI